jgi:hypothetical protein
MTTPTTTGRFLEMGIPDPHHVALSGDRRLHVATNDPRPAHTDESDAPMSRHRALALSEPPRSVRDDDDDDDDAPSPKRARRRPRPEHVSTPPRMADDDDDDDNSDARPAARRPRAKAAPKKKAAAKKGVTKPSGLRDSLPLEVTGIVLFALNVLLVLSLVSYTPGDGRPGHEAANWIGPGGAVVADLATITFGAVAFLLPVFVMVVVVACFRPVARPRHAALRTLAGLKAALATMTLLHLVFRGTQVMPFPAGGLIGALIADAGSRVLAPLGTGVVAVAAAFVGVVVALDRPLGGTTRSILDRLTDAWHGATEQLQVWREERRLLAEESARLEAAGDGAESLPGVDVAALAEQERERERAEKAEARRARIAEKARARATDRLERDAAAAEEARAAAEALQARAATRHEEAGPSPAVVVPLKPRARLPVASTPPTPAHEPVAVAPVLAPASLETATVVQSDPPWAKDIDDGAVISLAEAMERTKKRPAIPVGDDVVAGVGERAPTMLVDEELKIVERDDDVATLVAEAERLDEVAHVEEAQKREFVLPPLNLLDYDAPALEPIDEAKLRTQADKLVAKFMDFGIEGRVRKSVPAPSSRPMSSCRRRASR